MKNCRKAVAALALALLLSASAFAGEMHTDGSPVPPPANSEAITGATDGETQTGAATSAPGAMDTITGAALNLLQSLLTPF